MKGVSIQIASVVHSIRFLAGAFHLSTSQFSLRFQPIDKGTSVGVAEAAVSLQSLWVRNVDWTFE